MVTMTRRRISTLLGTIVLTGLVCGDALAAAAPLQAPQAPPKTSQGAAQRPPATATRPPVPVTPPAQVAPPPPDYVIGPDDVLIVLFRREKDMSAEVTVRPDGKITLQFLNDIQAAGLTPDQLRDKVTEEAGRLIEDPSVTIIVKQINSRKVFITGQVAKPGAYPIGTRMSVLQLIALAGGLTEYAKEKDIVIVREPLTRTGQRQAFKFDYTQVQKLKNLQTNIDLKPGDTVIVP
jgi:polysaccharide biosynthesis/export protein